MLVLVGALWIQAVELDFAGNRMVEFLGGMVSLEPAHFPL
jgi:hypothetical protein